MDAKRDRRRGGIVHSYQKYDPARFPSPTRPAGDVTGAAFEHLLRFGSLRRLTEEELARAVRIDPSQIAGLGPSLEALIALLEERKRKILETYEARSVLERARRAVAEKAEAMRPPPELAEGLKRAVRSGQIRDLNRLWYSLEDEQSRFAIDLLHLRERMGEQFEVEALAAKYDFTGREGMTVPRAIEIKEELETIDRLLEQLREAMKNAQIGVIDLEELSQFVEEADVDRLRDLQRQVEAYVRAAAEEQGIERTAEGLRLTPRAYRIFQSGLLEEVFSDLQAARSGRHGGPVIGEGAVETQRTKAYEFGDSIAHIDVGQTIANSIAREASEAVGRGSNSPLRVRVRPEDIEVHQTRNHPRCATAVLMDMSGSMRYESQYVNVKRMALALDGLIRTEYPGDFLAFFEVYSIAKQRAVAEIAELMPKPVTIYDPIVRLRADMSDPRITESMLPPHFTNIQHGLSLARRVLSVQATPNRQIALLTDGLPTAHFSDQHLFLLYPPDPATEEATMREAMLCAREGITINVFLLPSWSQSSEDIAFAHRMAEATRGRVFFTAGGEVDRFVLWDYVKMRRRIIG